MIETFKDLNHDDLKNFSIRIMKYNENVISIFLNKTNTGVMILAMEGEKPLKESTLNIGSLVKECVENFGGKGGGKKDYGQGFINNENLNVNDVKIYIMGKLSIT